MQQYLESSQGHSTYFIPRQGIYFYYFADSAKLRAHILLILNKNRNIDHGPIKVGQTKFTNSVKDSISLIV